MSGAAHTECATQPHTAICTAVRRPIYGKNTDKGKFIGGRPTVQMCGIASMGALACIRHSFALENNSTADANRVVSSCPLPATATTATSTMPVPTATTGRRRSTRTTRTMRGTSTSIRAITACATAAATKGYPFGPCACRPSTCLQCNAIFQSWQHLLQRMSIAKTFFVQQNPVKIFVYNLLVRLFAISIFADDEN